MSTAMPVLNTVTSIGALRSESLAPIVTSGGDAWYSMWKSILQDARPVQPAQDMRESPRRVDGTCVSTDFDSSASHELRDRGLLHSGRTSQVPHDDAKGGTATRSPACVATAQTPWPSTSDTDRIAASMQTSVVWKETSAGPTVQARGCARQAEVRAAGFYQIADAAPVQASPADSVHVFIQPAGVAIVVRDARVSDQQALQCAFEAARELTGHAAGLQRLTVNGRVLHRQPGDAVPVGPRLLLAC